MVGLGPDPTDAAADGLHHCYASGTEANVMALGVIGTVLLKVYIICRNGGSVNVIFDQAF